MQDGKGNELSIGDRVVFWGFYPPNLPSNLAGGYATVLSFGRKLVKVKADDDAYGTRNVPTCCLLKLSSKAAEAWR